MNRYDLIIRGETVHIEFERINDSRRLGGGKFGTNKKPNLFKIKAAMGCTINLPVALCPDWVSESYRLDYPTFPFNGVSFCSVMDDWSPVKGRHKALAEALQYSGHDDELNREITDAFTAEEAKRTKVKGPARIPKTAKPKPRRKSTLERIADALEILTRPGFTPQSNYTELAITSSTLGEAPKEN